MSGSAKVAAYRLHAAHCAEIAQRSSNPDARASLTKMSIAWQRLADLAEKNSESQEPNAERAATHMLVQPRQCCRGRRFLRHSASAPRALQNAQIPLQSIFRLL